MRRYVGTLLVTAACTAAGSVLSFYLGDQHRRHDLAAVRTQMAAESETRARSVRAEAETALGEKQLFGIEDGRRLGGIFADEHRGIATLSQAANDGSASAMLVLSAYYDDTPIYAGDYPAGKPRDAHAAKAWLAKATPLVAQGTNTRDLFYLASRYNYINPAKYKALMTRAADLGDCGAMAALILSDGADTWGPKMIRHVTDNPADGECAELVGTYAQHDRYWPDKPIIRSDRAAVYWWELALSRGDYNVLVRLERAFETGEGGAARDPWQACYYSRLRALYNGFDDSELKVGLCYLNPPAAWPHNPGRGRYWIAQAAAKESGSYHKARDARRLYPGPVSPDTIYSGPITAAANDPK